MKTLARSLLLVATLAAADAALAKEKLQFTAEESAVIAQLKSLQDEVGPAKREFVTAQLELTPEEAAKFWPVYEDHQKALAELNKRRLENVLAYARVYNAGHIEEVPADKLFKEAVAIEHAESDLLEKSYGRLKGRISAVKLVRYLQIESKLRAYLRLKQASEVPLAE